MTIDTGVRMSLGFESTGIWDDVRRMPRDLGATLADHRGLDAAAELLSAPGVQRIVASGNGASYYVAQALWLAALEGDRMPVEVVALPGGLLARGAFRWRDGDVLLVISSSGEFRDVIEAIEHADMPRPFATVTANPDGTIARQAGSVARVSVPEQRAVTHTQAFCGAVLACLAIWARISADDGLQRALDEAPGACQRAIDRTLAWAGEEFAGVETPTAAITFGTGPGWAAALENALLIKEVARVPCEGVETREGATAAMTGLLPQHLVLSLPTRDDHLMAEAESICQKLGARILRAPGGEEGDRRISPITTFPAATALAAELALRAGWSVDDPEWFSTYLSTARRKA